MTQRQQRDCRFPKQLSDKFKRNAGLHETDIHLNEEAPFIDLKPHLWRPLTNG
jgi:hypothetical protein